MTVQAKKGQIELTEGRLTHRADMFREQAGSKRAEILRGKKHSQTADILTDSRHTHRGQTYY